MLPWTFVTNHAVVLSLIARDPTVTGHALALKVGISERAIRRIISELYESGYITKGKEGRRVRYQIKPYARMRHKTQRDIPVRELLKVLAVPRKKESK